MFPKLAKWKPFKGHFQKCIGEGSGGKIYQSLVNNKIVAVKAIKKEQFRWQEAILPSILRKKGAKRIIDIEDVNDYGDYVCIVQELLDRDVFEVLKRRSWSAKEMDERLFMGQEMACAIKEVHERGMCHLDVKLENYMYGSMGGLRLIDFGAACVGRRACITHNAGTLQYSAPELISGEKEKTVSGATDVYSLGVCLFGLLSNLLPYNGHDRVAMSKQLPSVIRKHVPFRMTCLMDEMTAFDVNSRPTIDEVLAEMTAVDMNSCLGTDDNDESLVERSHA